MDATLRMKECDTMRILVVEDDRLLNNTLCYNLDAAGYVVDSALTKSAASNFLTKQHPSYSTRYYSKVGHPRLLKFALYHTPSFLV